MKLLANCSRLRFYRSANSLRNNMPIIGKFNFVINAYLQCVLYGSNNPYFGVAFTSASTNDFAEINVFKSLKKSQQFMLFRILSNTLIQKTCNNDVQYPGNLLYTNIKMNACLFVCTQWIQKPYIQSPRNFGISLGVSSGRFLRIFIILGWPPYKKLFVNAIPQ